ncbi:unnamed protein product [Penicillium salamii]|uniref:DUF3669 domain-containing protein n=1 Tax=Penicillium salamii TaxID=1612424 RepID=A0A9W4JNW3_9EURO|nr:unnamed protein product [Penicillium salamii]
MNTNMNEKEIEARLRKIGQGFCGTVWAASTGPAFKREDGGPARSLRNDFEMHRRVHQGFQKSFLRPQTTIPACYDFIDSIDVEWWSVNQQKFPPGYTPCNVLLSQRIPPFTELIRRLLIDTYRSPNIRQQIINSESDKDCLIRPYLGRRRTQRAHTTSRFSAFSLRNFPLHLDQMESLGVATSEINQYARSMAETLAMMHWVCEIDGKDVEFVLAPSSETGFQMNSAVFGTDSLWVLDFDLCRTMEMNSEGVVQAAAAFWRNDTYYPRPGKDPSLWSVFQEYYIYVSEACGGETEEEAERRIPSRYFIELVEQEGKLRKEIDDRSSSSV